jgi:hypothetical protein
MSLLMADASRWHGPRREYRFQQLFCCCVRVCCRQLTPTESLSADRSLATTVSCVFTTPMASTSKLEILERFQSKTLRMIVDAL